MKIVINNLAVERSSRGVRRYLKMLLPWIASGIERSDGELEFLQPGLSNPLDRIRELAYRPSGDPVFWSPCQRGSLRATHQVITVHDCINIEHTYADDFRGRALKTIFGEILLKAQRVVAISDATRQSLLRHYRLDPDKLLVIRSPSDIAAAPDLEAVAGINRPFILMVTNPLKHKNSLFACRAYAISKYAAEQVTLCVVGGLDPAARTFCVDSGVQFVELNHVDDSRLSALYRDCALFLSASLSEGHNLTIAEALSIGAPVACSKIPAHE